MCMDTLFRIYYTCSYCHNEIWKIDALTILLLMSSGQKKTIFIICTVRWLHVNAYILRLQILFYTSPILQIIRDFWMSFVLCSWLTGSLSFAKNYWGGLIIRVNKITLLITLIRTVILLYVMNWIILFEGFLLFLLEFACFSLKS